MASGSLQDFVQEVSGESHLRVEHDFGDGFVRLKTSEAERRQAAQDIQCSENIVLELLRNSRDAHASHVFLAISKEGNTRTITVIDDGDGIPPSMHEHVFEPRVTSKLDTSHMDAWGLHGRGMALFSIAENSVSACVAASDVNLGCSMHIETDTEKLPEKTDQSSFPTFELSESGVVNVRGPRNILRTSCEFAIESRDSCSVYIGSIAEIAATLFEYGKSTLSAFDRAFCKDATNLPLIKRLATAADPDDLALAASEIGLDVSSRTARRIMDGQVAEAESLLDRIEIAKPGARTKSSGRPRTKSGKRTRISKEDAAAFTEEIRKAYADIAEKYYLDASVEPRLRTTGDSVIVSIPLVDRE